MNLDETKATDDRCDTRHRHVGTDWRWWTAF